MKHILFIIALLLTVTASAQVPTWPKPISVELASDTIWNDSTDAADTLLLPPSAYLQRSATCREAAFIMAGVTVTAAAILAHLGTADINHLAVEPEDMLRYATVVGIVGGVAALILEVVSISNEKKAARALGNIRVTSNGIAIQF